jgi:hypothetical protein
MTRWTLRTGSGSKCGQLPMSIHYVVNRKQILYRHALPRYPSVSPSERPSSTAGPHRLRRCARKKGAD